MIANLVSKHGVHRTTIKPWRRRRAMEGMASVFTSSGLENVSQASAPKDFRQFPLDPISLGLIHFIK